MKSKSTNISLKAVELKNTLFMCDLNEAQFNYVSNANYIGFDYLKFSISKLENLTNERENANNWDESTT